MSVVVPIYNVEAYLADCLQSIASQSHADLEVVMVDDGSTDGSADIAAGFAADDARFRLLRRANGGLSRARNTGLDTADGDYLAFVDSDDVLPHDAYERMLAAVTATGSDFATGNVRRLTARGLEQAQFLARTFSQTRLATHVTECRSLIADRTAWNKLFRRRFWDEHELRFPEDRVHEDIPVMLPAHFRARRVDVLASPVYHWRRREDGDQSITQRRLELPVLRDRLTAIEEVRAFLADHPCRKARRWYDERIVADDLRLHLELLHLADAEYRDEFARRVTAMLREADPRVFRGVKAITRLEWHLLLRGLVDEAAEVARFQAEEAAGTPPLRRRGRYYGDYPFRTDPELRVPRRIYRLGRADAELALHAQVESIEAQDGALRIRGHAHIAGLGAREARTQHVAAGALRKSRWRRVRMHLLGGGAPTRRVYRPDLIAAGRRELAWAGFEATIDPAQLSSRRSGDEAWEVFVRVRTGFVVRRRAKFVVAAPEVLPAVHAHTADGRLARAAVSAEGALTVDARATWLRLDATRRAGERLLLSGRTRGIPDGALALELRRRCDDWRLEIPLGVADGRFWAALPVDAVRDAGPSLEARARRQPEAPQFWDLRAHAGGRRLAIAPGTEPLAGGWLIGGREWVMVVTPAGDIALLERDGAAAAAAAGAPPSRAGAREDARAGSA